MSHLDDLQDDPLQWRSAVDPKSGKTYWYHRVSRVSTWIRPLFLDDSTADTQGNNLIERISSLDHNYKESGYLSTTNSVANRSSEEIYQRTELDKETVAANNTRGDTRNDVADSFEEDFTINLSNAVSCLTSSDEYSRVDALLLLSSRCGVAVETSVQLAKMEFLLGNLVVIISRGDSKKCRRLALKILCSLAICEDASFIFRDNQSWTIISKDFLHWEGDKESTLLYCILVCGVLNGPSKSSVPSETTESIGDLLGFMLDDYRNYSKSEQIDLASLQLITSHSSSSFIPGDWSFLYYLYAAAEKGHQGPSLLLLVILSSAVGSISSFSEGNEADSNADECVNNEGLMYDILRAGGGASVLLGLCVCRRVHQDVRSRARMLLEEGMSVSAYLRERVLDVFLGLSSDYSSLVEDLDEESAGGEELEEDESSVLERNRIIWGGGAGDGGGIFEECVGERLQAQALRGILDVTWRPCREGEREGKVPWENQEQDYGLADSRDSVGRGGGTEMGIRMGMGMGMGGHPNGLRISYAAVWARCPLLRPTLTQHRRHPTNHTTSKPHTPLCLAVDASYDALSYVTRYVHNGILLLPAVSTDRDLSTCLEVMKIAHQWGMTALLSEMSEMMGSVLTDDTVHECELYGRSYGIPALVSVCRTFRASEGARATERLDRTAALLLSGKRGAGPRQSNLVSQGSVDPNGPHTHSSSDGLAARGTVPYGTSGFQGRPEMSQERTQVQAELDYDNIYGGGDSLQGIRVGEAQYGQYGQHSGREESTDNYSSAYNRQHLLRDLYNEGGRDQDEEEEGEGEEGSNYFFEKEKEKEKEKGSHHKKKLKSGGIYGLLLKSGHSSAESSLDTRYVVGERQGGEEGQREGEGYDRKYFRSDGRHSDSGVRHGEHGPEGRVGDLHGWTSAVNNTSNTSTSSTISSANRSDSRTQFPSSSSAHKSNPTHAAHAPPTHRSGAPSPVSDPALKSSPPTPVPVPVHLRPKSAFGRSSAGTGPGTGTGIGEKRDTARGQKGQGPHSTYTERTHSGQRSSTDSEPRKNKSAVQVVDLHPGMGTGPVPGTGFGGLGGDSSSLGARSNSPPRKYSMTGRVTAIPSNGGNRPTAGAGAGAGTGTGNTKVAAVFRLLENSIEQEIAASQQAVSRGIPRYNAPQTASLSLSSSLQEDDDVSMTTYGSTLASLGLDAEKAQEGGRDRTGGNVRQSLMLLKARTKSSSTMRPSRHSSVNCSSRNEERVEGHVETETEVRGQGQGQALGQGQGSKDEESVSSSYSQHVQYGQYGSSRLSQPEGPSMSLGRYLSESSHPSRNTVPTVQNRSYETETASYRGPKPASNYPHSRQPDQTDLSFDSSPHSPNQRPPSTIPCPHCGRNFAAEPLERHIKICSKICSKKRRVFDSVQMRGVSDSPSGPPKRQGESKTGPGSLPPRGGGGGGGGGGGKPSQSQPQQTDSKWRAQSEMFRESLKAARVTTEAIASGRPIPPPTRSVDPSLVPCPHCCRRFNEKAAERHIPVCSSIRAKPTMLLRGTGVGPGQATHSAHNKTYPALSRNTF